MLYSVHYYKVSLTVYSVLLYPSAVMNILKHSVVNLYRGGDLCVLTLLCTPVSAVSQVRPYRVV